MFFTKKIKETKLMNTQLENLNRIASSVFEGIKDFSIEMEEYEDTFNFALKVPSLVLYINSLTFKELKFYLYGYSDAKETVTF